MQQRKIRFLVLNAFSNWGGIEKFNRAFIRALVELAPALNCKVSFAGMYDDQQDERYAPADIFQPFFGRRLQFVFQSIVQSWKQDELIIGHMNLAIIGLVFKLFRPRRKLIVICHGIEVFEPLTGIKKKLLKQADQILAVSAFTKNKLVQVQGMDAAKISIFPNTLDPFFELPSNFSKPSFLQQRYGIKAHEKVIFTLTRLNSNEGYKGYDKIINILPLLKNERIPFKYILAGKADEGEKRRMEALIQANGLSEQVIMPGYIPNNEVTAHYLLADVFVMPSKGEGFGIVFLEAMACGLAVVAGNKDGSVDALKNGAFGSLVDPDIEADILKGLIQQLRNTRTAFDLQQSMLQDYSFNRFKDRLEKIIHA